MSLLPSNITKLGMLPCRACGTYEQRSWDEKSFESVSSSGCRSHWLARGPKSYTHFLLSNKWYVLPEKYTEPLLSLVEVATAMCIQGAMYLPNPTRIDNLTDLFALLKRNGVSEEALATQFPSAQVERMKGRVFKKLVKGK